MLKEIRKPFLRDQFSDLGCELTTKQRHALAALRAGLAPAFLGLLLGGGVLLTAWRSSDV